MDEEAAGAAGIPFVHAAYGFGRAERPVGTIESLSQLTALAKETSGLGAGHESGRM